MISLKEELSYKLDNNLKEEIIKVKKATIKNDYEIYLFGSIAKGKYSKNSDIDILILINEEKNLKELRVLRHLIEDEIENLKLTRDVDIKVYSKNRFLELTNKISFEQSILNDLINIMRW